MALFGVRTEITKRLQSAKRFFPSWKGTIQNERDKPSNDNSVDDAAESSDTPLYINSTVSEGPSSLPLRLTAELANVRWDDPDEKDHATTKLPIPTTTAIATLEPPIATISSSSVDLRIHLDVLPVNHSTVLTRAKNAASSSHVRLYTLPQVQRNLSKLELEFRGMLEFFANYSEADILSIADPRKRALFEGIAASSYSRPVYRAFEVLFEDLLPLRYAGRIIFTKLQEFMAASIEQRKTDIHYIVQVTGMSSKEDIRQLEEIRLMFVSTASQMNGGLYLTSEQLAETGIITTTATEVLGMDSVDDVCNHLDKTSSGKLTFVDLMVGLWELANEHCGLEFCNPRVVLHNVLVELNEHPPPPTDLNARLDSQRRRYSARYDEMVASFIEWKHLLPPATEHENRRMEVVRGCFVGAELPKVVDALRVVYVDYVGLRVAGDIIFKLAATILNRRA
jgi:hypothetical protein